VYVELLECFLSGDGTGMPWCIYSEEEFMLELLRTDDNVSESFACPLSCEDVQNR
jgi:hypothetical protein